MTKHDAYREMYELDNIEIMWDRHAIVTRKGLTPYQAAIVSREHVLYEYWRFNAPAPVSQAEWQPTCPERDVEETVENWFRNNYCFAKDPQAWQRRMREAGGKIPELVIQYPDFSLYADARPTDVSLGA